MKLRVYLKDMSKEQTTETYSHCNYFNNKVEFYPNFEESYEEWEFENKTELSANAQFALDADSNVKSYQIFISDVDSDANITDILDKYSTESSETFDIEKDYDIVLTDDQTRVCDGELEITESLKLESFRFFESDGYCSAVGYRIIEK